MSSRLKYLANKQQSATLTMAEGNEYNRLEVEYATHCYSGTRA